MSIITFFAVAAAAGATDEFAVAGGDGLKVRMGEAFAVASNATYVVECEAKRLGSGTVLFGTTEANVDDSSSWSGWKRKSAVFRSAATTSRISPRFGSFNLASGTVFRAFAIFPVKAEYARADGMPFGHGESIRGNDYSFDSQFGSGGRNDSRPLHAFRGAYFNTHRWCLHDGVEIIFRHELAGRRLLSGEVKVGAIHRGGSFTVEVSTDGAAWQPLMTVTNATIATAAVPAQLLPSRELFVRLAGRKQCALQVNSYGFKAKVDGAPCFAAGSTRYVKGDGAIVAECRPPVLYDASYGEVVADGAVGTCWQASSGWKVARHRAIPGRRAKEVLVRAAANEAESVQLVVSPRTGLADVQVSCAGLVRKKWLGLRKAGDIPPSAIEVRRVGYVTVDQPTDAEGCRGDWPDPLLPQGDGPVPVKVGENQPFWITVTVPKGTPAGIYRGRLAVAMKTDAGAAQKVEVPFAVEVFGFSMPDVVTLKSSFGMNALQVAGWHHAKTDAEKRRVLDLYHRGFSAYRISHSRPAPYDDWEPKWDKSAGAGSPEKWEPVFDWSRWDAAVEHAFAAYRFNAINVKPWRFWNGFGDMFRKPDLAGLKSDHPAYMTLLRKYLRAVCRHLKEKGWLDKAYIYWYDEPTGNTYDKVREGMKVLQEEMPGVKRLLTEQPEAELIGFVDIWSPMPHYIHTPHEAACRAAGNEFWWYLCCEPRAPYFTEFIDHAGAEMRLWGWASWKSQISGILMWETTYWTSSAAYPDPRHPQNPYLDPMGWVSGGQAKPGEKRPWGNGDGRFFYPPMKCIETAGDAKAPFIDVPPVPTQRLALIRDGVEDYEYLTILKKLDPGSPLLAVPPEICVSDTEFSVDPAAMEARRLQVARAIERLAGAR